MLKRPMLIVFAVGLILGVAGTVLVPRYLRPYIPESIRGKETTVDGEVLAKQLKGNALLLTLNTPQGALLATFKKRADEVNLLVGLHDTVEFTLGKYSPFVEDPRITAVRKTAKTALPEQEKAPEPAPKPAEKTPSAKPRHAERPAPAPPSSKPTQTAPSRNANGK